MLLRGEGKKISRKHKTALLAALLLCLPLSGCGNSSDADENTSDYKTVETAIETDYLNLSFRELSDGSDLVVLATFHALSDSFRVRPAGGGDPLIFTDANFEAVRAYKGDIESDDTIVVRIPGGEAVDKDQKIVYRETNADAPSFIEGKEYLLFLVRPGVDRYKTKEDYYELVTGTKAVYVVSGEQLENLTDSSKTIGRAELDSIDATVDPKELERKEMDEKLKDGSITQEEYDAYFKAFEQYGKKE